MPGCEVRGEFIHCQAASPKKFDKRSFRVKTVKKNLKLVVGCPKGQYSPRKKQCKVGMRMQKAMCRPPRYTKAKCRKIVAAAGR